VVYREGEGGDQERVFEGRSERDGDGKYENEGDGEREYEDGESSF